MDVITYAKTFSLHFHCVLKNYHHALYNLIHALTIFLLSIAKEQMKYNLTQWPTTITEELTKTTHPRSLFQKKSRLEKKQ